MLVNKHFFCAPVQVDFIRARRADYIHMNGQTSLQDHIQLAKEWYETLSTCVFASDEQVSVTVDRRDGSMVMTRSKGGLIHSANDMPAKCYYDGRKYWYYNGGQHRFHDKPAVTYRDGGKEWWFASMLHRDDGRPAIIRAGYRAWYVCGLRLLEEESRALPPIETDADIRVWGQEHMKYALQVRANTAVVHLHNHKCPWPADLTGCSVWFDNAEVLYLALKYTKIDEEYCLARAREYSLVDVEKLLIARRN